MIGKTNAGGGASLNFKVVGGLTQPADPAENTIWVNTDVSITSYVFSPVEPEAPEQGMVWFRHGNLSNVSFNALKKNAIRIYPSTVQQYIDGEWVRLTAKSGRRGEWVDWALYAYNKGDTCDSVHGGWTTSTRWYQTNAKAPTITYNADSITFRIYCSSAANRQSGIGETVDGVDLTDLKTITFEIKEVSAETSLDGSWRNVYVGVTANLTGSITMAAQVQTLAAGTYTLDVSSLEGVHDIVVKLVSTGQVGTYTTVSISEIRLE